MTRTKRNSEPVGVGVPSASRNHDHEQPDPTDHRNRSPAPGSPLWGIFPRKFLPGSFYQKKFTRKFLGACLFRTHDRMHDNSDQDGAGDGVPFSCWFVFFAAPRTMIADVRRSRPPLISRIPQRIRRSHPPNPPIFRGVSTARNRA